MANKDLVKGYCKESKCEYDVYTKEKMDEILTAKDNTIQTLNTTLETLNTKLENLESETILKKEVKNIMVNIMLQKKVNGIYTTFKTINATMPIKLAKSGAMIRMKPEIITSTNQSETKAEIVDGILRLYISTSDTTTLANNSGRILIQGANVSELNGYLPIYSKDAYNHASYDYEYVKIIFTDNFYMYLTDNVSQGGVWEAAFTYMADNVN